MSIYKSLIYHKTFLPLLFVLCLCCGTYSLTIVNKQLWPTYETSYGSVSISWPNAAIEAVDNQISRHLDVTLSSVSGISDISTTSDIGVSVANFRIEIGEDPNQVIRNVEQAVRSISGLPNTSLPASATLYEPSDLVARLKVSGPFDEKSALVLVGEVIDKLNQSGITKVRKLTTSSLPIYINVDLEKMRSLGLTRREIEEKVASRFGPPSIVSLEDNASRQTISIRSGINPAYLGDLVIRNNLNAVLLSDVAKISERKFDNTVSPVFREKGGFFLQIERGKNDDLNVISSQLQIALEELRNEFPDSVQFELFSIEANSLIERIGLLSENAITGIILVFIVLFLGVGFRAAVWVSVGLITTYALSFGGMYLTGQTINYVSVFAMIMVLGILVDDAIIVAEQVSYHEEIDSTDPIVDAVNLTWRPVFVSTATTLAGFAPILLLQDSIGSYVAAIPLFVCTALIASYFECFVFLPKHMKSKLFKTREKQYGYRRKYFASLTEICLVPVRRTASCSKKLSLTILALLTIAVIFFFTSNPAKFQFWLNPSSKVVLAYVTTGANTTRNDTEKTLEEIWLALDEVLTETNLSKEDVVSFGVYGQHFLKPFRVFESSRSTIFAEILDDNTKDEALAQAWQDEVDARRIDAIVSISGQQIGLDEPDLVVVLRQSNLDNLRSATVDLFSKLREKDNTAEFVSSLFSTNENLALVPNNFYRDGLSFDGAEIETAVANALRVFEGKFNQDGFERKYFISFGSSASPLATLEQTFNELRPNLTNFDTITASTESGLVPIRRSGGELSTKIEISLSETSMSASEFAELIESDVLPSLQANYGITYEFAGALAVQNDTLRRVGIALALAILLMFVTLSISFGDYKKPLIILISLPIGMVGGTLGHLLMGHPVTLLSLVAFLGLSGILVNDLVLLVEAYDRARMSKLEIAEAIVEGFRKRLRAVVLTTITTTFGLLPLMLDKNPEAQFLIPIAISIVFGLTFSMILNVITFPLSIRALLR